MSHYSVAVICESKKGMIDLLKPYQEYNGCDENAQYFEFYDLTDDVKNRFYDEENLVEVVVMRNGKLIEKYANYFLRVVDDEDVARAKAEADGKPYETTTKINDNGEKVILFYDWGKRDIKEVQVSHFYKDYIEYGKDHGYTWNSKYGKFGYYYNPNAKFDWCEVGGRYANMLKLNSGDMEFENIAKIKDVDFRFIVEKYNEYKRIWEVIVEGEKPTEEEIQNGIRFWDMNALIKAYGQKEKFAMQNSMFKTHAVITPDGKWHSAAEVGYFGVVYDEKESAEVWASKYYNRFIASANKEHYIGIFDLHT